MAGGSTRMGGFSYNKNKNVNKSKMKTTTSDKDNDIQWYDNQIVNPKMQIFLKFNVKFYFFFRLITEKFKSMEKTFKAAIQEQNAKNSKNTLVKGSTSLIESSMRTSPLQSMVY